MKLRIKLCGVRRIADALLCAEAGADEIGVILAPSSKRCVSLAEARAIREALPAHLPLVGVFLDASLAELVAAAEGAKLCSFQLHGSLAGFDPAARRLGPLVRALQVSGPESLQEVPSLRQRFDRLLLDGPRGGGSGSRFDWRLALQAAAAFPGGEIFVAGGLSADNVGEAIRAARPDGVDVASGIEGADGFKDPGRVRAFIAAARAAAAPL